MQIEILLVVLARNVLLRAIHGFHGWKETGDATGCLAILSFRNKLVSFQAHLEQCRRQLLRGTVYTLIYRHLFSKSIQRIKFGNFPKKSEFRAYFLQIVINR